MLTEQQFEALLATRNAPPVRPGLAERIIAACPARLPTPTFGEWLQESLAGFLLPKPAYSLAMALALGLIIGFSSVAPKPDAQYAIATYEDDGAAP